MDGAGIGGKGSLTCHLRPPESSSHPLKFQVLPSGIYSVPGLSWVPRKKAELATAAALKEIAWREGKESTRKGSRPHGGPSCTLNKGKVMSELNHQT